MSMQKPFHVPPTRGDSSSRDWQAARQSVEGGNERGAFWACDSLEARLVGNDATRARWASRRRFLVRDLCKWSHGNPAGIDEKQDGCCCSSEGLRLDQGGRRPDCLKGLLVATPSDQEKESRSSDVSFPESERTNEGRASWHSVRPFSLFFAGAAG